MRVTSKPSEGQNVTIGIERGVLGTTAETHEIEAPIISVARYENINVIDAAIDLLLNYAKIPDKYINLTDWQNERDIWLSLFSVSATIADEEIKVSDLIGELCEEAGLYIWWDGEQIRLKGVHPELSPAYALTDEHHIIKDSFALEGDANQRASRIYIYYNRKSPIKDEKKVNNYGAASLFIDGDSEFAYKSQKTKAIYSRWIKDLLLADSVGARLLKRYAYAQENIKISIDEKDDVNLKLGDVIKIYSVYIQDERGQPTIKRYQIIEKKDKQIGESVDLLAQFFEFEEAERYSYYAADGILDYNRYTIANRPNIAFYAGDNELILNQFDANLYA
jgi:hypothetical protein